MSVPAYITALEHISDLCATAKIESADNQLTSCNEAKVRPCPCLYLHTGLRCKVVAVANAED